MILSLLQLYCWIYNSCLMNSEIIFSKPKSLFLMHIVLFLPNSMVWNASFSQLYTFFFSLLSYAFCSHVSNSLAQRLNEFTWLLSNVIVQIRVRASIHVLCLIHRGFDMGVPFPPHIVWIHAIFIKDLPGGPTLCSFFIKRMT